MFIVSAKMGVQDTWFLMLIFVIVAHLQNGGEITGFFLNCPNVPGYWMSTEFSNGETNFSITALIKYTRSTIK